jgi:hypothetical protein
MTELTSGEEKRWKAKLSELVDHRRELATYVDIKEVIEHIDGDLYLAGVLEAALKHGDQGLFYTTFMAGFDNYFGDQLKDEHQSEWLEMDRHD